MPVRKKVIEYYACDFETTVWGEKIEKEKKKKQDHTEVWSAAYVKLYDDTETVTIQNSIRDFLDTFLSIEKIKCVLYFHNLSFDGSFIIDFLLREGYKFTAEEEKNMPNKTFNSCISKMGDWYFLKIKKGHVLLEIRNSLKLIPASLKRIGESFKTKHQKLDMEYYGDRHAYCHITEEEKEYIRNDVLVLKEALERMFNEGHDKLTIGSCCLSEFKQTYDKTDYKMFFPNLTEIDLPEEYGSINAWEYVHKSYSGGWCFVNPKYARTTIGNGVVYDVNSLYPSMMHSESCNKYPVGLPKFWKGETPEKVIQSENLYYYVRFRCRFTLKENAYPWIHIRNTSLYKGNENLYTTDVRKNSKYSRFYFDENGEVQDTTTELTMTMHDFNLMKETYNIHDLEMLDGCYFRTETGIFDEYINYYKELKIKSTGFLREIAKLFLNNLYGKLAMSDDSSYKEPYLDENAQVNFKLHDAHEKSVGYIPCGSAITSYARNFTIRVSLANFDRFCYADTDSIHLTGEDDAVGITEHPTNFCCWEQECKFDYAFYERQKVYAEHVTEKNHEKCTPYLNLKCAGMGANAKKAFIESNRDISELTCGLLLEDCNLKAKRIHGGILLQNTSFKIRNSVDKNVNCML